jgi:hypothetical protein
VSAFILDAPVVSVVTELENEESTNAESDVAFSDVRLPQEASVLKPNKNSRVFNFLLTLTVA